VELRRYFVSTTLSVRIRALIVCGLLLVLGIAGFLLLKFSRTGGLRDRPLHPRPPIEGRLCGVYAPLLSSPGESPVSREPRDSGLDGDSIRLRDLLAERPARAVALLERATRKSTRDPRVLSDLSAAYLTRAGREVRPDDLVRGLAAALQAVRLAPNLPEAAFNRALALEKLSLKGAATEAWEAITRNDPDPEWRREAERHRQALARPAPWQLWDASRSQLEQAAARQDANTVTAIVRIYPQPARENAETQGLGAWGDAVAAGDTAGAQRALWLAGTIGDALANLTGDLMLRDAVATIRRTAADPAGGRLELLARGHRTFRDGRALYETLAFEKAAPLMESASADLEQGGSPMADWAAFYRAVCFYRQKNFEASLESLGRIARDPGHATRHPILLGYAEWMIGAQRSDGGQLGESVDRCQHALRLFERTAQVQNVAAVHDLLAHDLDLLGDSRESWTHLARALESSDKILKRRWVVTILEKAATCALRMDQPAVGLELHQEAVRTAFQQNDPLVVSEAIVARSLSRLQSGDSQGALRDLDEARRWMARKSDSSMRRVVEVQIEAATGKALRGVDPARGIAALDRAIDLYGKSGAPVLKTELYVERGRSQLALGRDDLAEKDFAAGIEDFERNRQKIFAEGLRISYFEQVRPVFDEMVRLQLDRRKDPWRAFRLSEQARARELLDTLTGGAARALLDSLESGQAGKDLPADVALVHYAVLEDRTLTWVLTRDRSEVFDRPVGSREIQRRVGALVIAIRKRTDAKRIRSLSASLYDDLIRPVADLLRPGSTLVLAPDLALHKLPFAALYDSAAGRYLVEEHPLAVTPSAALVLYRMGRHAGSPHPGEIRRALVVGNPRIDLQNFHEISPLPGAEEEARKVAALYPEPLLLTGAAATRDRFLAEAGGHEVVHFAGHALSNEEIPLLSMLLLAPDAASGSSGELTAQEIYKQKFASTRLVVLGACSTTSARISPSEGVLGLARPFLAAEVPDVVSTLWEVEDATTPALFQAFHRRLRAGDSPIQALRAAQLDLLRNANPELSSPASWAPFEVIQGSGR
jgi:CHAT domain-containing protein